MSLPGPIVMLGIRGTSPGDAASVKFQFSALTRPMTSYTQVVRSAKGFASHSSALRLSLSTPN